MRIITQLSSMFELLCKFKEIERSEYMEKILNSESKPYKLILTSRGLNTNIGKDIIRKVYDKEKIEAENAERYEKIKAERGWK